MNQIARIHSDISEAPEQLDYNQGEAVELSECVVELPVLKTALLIIF